MSSSLLSKNITIQIYRTVIFPVVLYGCEARSLKLRNVKPRAFENRMLRKTFLPKEDVKGGCVCIIRTDQNWAGVWQVWKRCTYRVLVRKPEGKRQPGRPRR